MGTPSSKPRSGCCGLLCLLCCSSTPVPRQGTAERERERGEESGDSNLPQHRRTWSGADQPTATLCLHSTHTAMLCQCSGGLVLPSYRAS